MKSIFIYTFSLVLSFHGCSKTTMKKGDNPSLNPNAAPNLHLLFVGNSLTYTNDLPTLLKELAKQDNLNLSYTAFTFPNYALEDHLKDGKFQRELATGKYDFVIAQQGPSALPESQVLLMRDAAILADLCKKSGHSKLALYMVWPALNRSFDLDNVIYSYTNAAKKTESLLCATGLAWKYAWQTNAELPLYGNDNFHPSVMGSALAALTIYGALRDKKDFNFVKYSQLSWKSDVSEAKFEILKQAALKALKK
jgi:hypothetical protein